MTAQQQDRFKGSRMDWITEDRTGYRLKVSLLGIRPQIWRRFVVPASISLDRLHDVIQIVMPWEDKHLHCFNIDGKCYTEDPEDRDTDGQEEQGIRLRSLVRRIRQKFTYEYDFGDGWRHELVLEERLPVPEGYGLRLMCLEGRRACPPEDVGGTTGYAEFLKVLKDPKHPDHEHYVSWSGGHFVASAFDPEEVNLELLKYVRWSRPRVASPSEEPPVA